MTDIKIKKFIVIPRDAFDVLDCRYASFEEASAAASERCSETGMAVMVVELKAVAARADRPVTVKKV